MSVGDVVEIDAGAAMETRKIASIQTPPVAANAGDRGGFGRRGETRGQTTVWQPLPDGPVITIPAGSTNLPVTSVTGFESGQKMAIGYGAAFPTVAQAIEKVEVVTITNVGKPGTQAWLSMDAKAGDTNIKVSSVENISVGDKIRLDIASEGHGIETVTVTRVGTQSSRTTFNGPLTGEDDPGTGLDLAEPLRFDHASNMPFSVKGTGISFKPATAFDHSSNEPVLALMNSITLDQPLTADHDIHAVVRDAKVTTAGYQGSPAPDQWVGGPALSVRAGNMVLRDSAGRVVDSQNYGGLVDPWAAEGYQAASGAGASGCSVPTPIAGGGRFGFFGMSAYSFDEPNLSAGRYPDGLDTDSNCTDFRVQSSGSLSTAVDVGANNIKVTGVEGFVAGQKIVIDAGTNLETAVIAMVGTAGGATLLTAAEEGATMITVTNVTGFSSGQTITIDSGANHETTVVASVTPGRRAFGNFSGRDATITVDAPLRFAHAVGVQVSGSGITLAAPLTRAHNSGAPIANGVPTPGAPNLYY
ncbi:MAG: hypothetical protein EHM72_13265 [Calditrichaeota bacterium]|nr:MAG: hypothetical protein EHM72_13265 [Calditrichota bacterium]